MSCSSIHPQKAMFRSICSLRSTSLTLPIRSPGCPWGPNRSSHAGVCASMTRIRRTHCAARCCRAHRRAASPLRRPRMGILDVGALCAWREAGEVRRVRAHGRMRRSSAPKARLSSARSVHGADVPSSGRLQLTTPAHQTSPRTQQRQGRQARSCPWHIRLQQRAAPRGGPSRTLHARPPQPGVLLAPRRASLLPR